MRVRVHIGAVVVLTTGLVASTAFAAKSTGKDWKEPARTHRIVRFAPDAVPTIDADGADWAGIPKDYWITVKDQHTTGDGKGADDLQVVMGYCPEKGRLYVLVKVKDNYLKASRKRAPKADPYYPFHDDIFEIVVDADTTGGNFVRFKKKPGATSRPLTGCHTQNYHIYLIGPPGPKHVWLWGDQHWLTAEPYARFAHKMTGTLGGPGTVVLEVYITPFNYAHRAGPEHSAVAPLVPGEKIGVGWLRLDEDGSAPRRIAEGDDYFFGHGFRLCSNADYLFDVLLDQKVHRARVGKREE
jgi:hypothetical protein